MDKNKSVYKSLSVQETTAPLARVEIEHARINVACTGGSTATRLKFKVILFNALRHATCAQLVECKQ